MPDLSRHAELTIALNPAGLQSGAATVRSSLDDIRKAADEGMTHAIARADAALTKLGSNTGNVRAARAEMLQGTIAVNELRKAIDEARASGGPVPPGAEEKLKNLETALSGARQRMKEIRESVEQAREQMKLLGIGMSDELASRIGTVMAKLGSLGVGLVVAREAFKTLVEVGHKLGEGITWVAEQMEKQAEAARKAAEDQETLANGIKLALRGFGEMPETVEKAREQLDIYALSIGRSAAASEVLKKLGISVPESFDKISLRAQALGAAVEGAFKRSEYEGNAMAVEHEADAKKLVEAYEMAGKAVPANIQKMLDKSAEFRAKSKLLGTGITDAQREMIADFGEISKAMEGFGGDLSKVSTYAERHSDVLSSMGHAYERTGRLVGSLSAQQEEEIATVKAGIAADEAAYKTSNARISQSDTKVAKYKAEIVQLAKLSTEQILERTGEAEGIVTGERAIEWRNDQVAVLKSLIDKEQAATASVRAEVDAHKASIKTLEERRKALEEQEREEQAYGNAVDERTQKVKDALIVDETILKLRVPLIGSYHEEQQSIDALLLKMEEMKAKGPAAFAAWAAANRAAFADAIANASAWGNTVPDEMLKVVTAGNAEAAVIAHTSAILQQFGSVQLPLIASAKDLAEAENTFRASIAALDDKLGTNMMALLGVTRSMREADKASREIKQDFVDLLPVLDGSFGDITRVGTAWDDLKKKADAEALRKLSDGINEMGHAGEAAGTHLKGLSTNMGNLVGAGKLAKDSVEGAGIEMKRAGDQAGSSGQFVTALGQTWEKLGGSVSQAKSSVADYNSEQLKNDLTLIASSKGTREKADAVRQLGLQFTEMGRQAIEDEVALQAAEARVKLLTDAMKTGTEWGKRYGAALSEAGRGAKDFGQWVNQIPGMIRGGVDSMNALDMASDKAATQQGRLSDEMSAAHKAFAEGSMTYDQLSDAVKQNNRQLDENARQLENAKQAVDDFNFSNQSLVTTIETEGNLLATNWDMMLPQPAKLKAANAAQHELLQSAADLVAQYPLLQVHLAHFLAQLDKGVITESQFAEAVRGIQEANGFIGGQGDAKLFAALSKLTKDYAAAGDAAAGAAPEVQALGSAATDTATQMTQAAGAGRDLAGSYETVGAASGTVTHTANDVAIATKEMAASTTESATQVVNAVKAMSSGVSDAAGQIETVSHLLEASVQRVAKGADASANSVASAMEKAAAAVESTQRRIARLLSQPPPAWKMGADNSRFGAGPAGGGGTSIGEQALQWGGR